MTDYLDPEHEPFDDDHCPECGASPDEACLSWCPVYAEPDDEAAPEQEGDK